MILAAYGLLTAAVLMAMGWIISVARHDAGVADVLWGPVITATGISYLMGLPTASWRGWIAVTLVAIWALRLAIHVVYRNHGKPEDRRYREIRARNEPGFWWRSAYLIFGLQAVLAWIVAMPLLGVVQSASPLHLLDLVGGLLWVTGFTFEAVADYQLLRFQSRAGAERGVMDKGLWRYSRHPNYFGECCLWWGMWLVALGAGAWWTVIGPLLLTFLLLRVSGVALTEKDIADRRPDYQQYVLRTSAFFPRVPR
ncbi:MAG: DUF1295 domain-containing protein [Gammaproteobacteria bacterium]